MRPSLIRSTYCATSSIAWHTFFVEQVIGTLSYPLQLMQVTRCQYPIGQGCISSGRIRSAQDESERAVDFRYIYDCGSTNQRPLGDAIDSYWKHNTSVDALFVSHLHVDHVNGIDRLLGAVEVDTV